MTKTFQVLETHEENTTKKNAPFEDHVSLPADIQNSLMYRISKQEKSEHVEDSIENFLTQNKTNHWEDFWNYQSFRWL